MSKKGFTLAEVLIVLGVIGVVAALTIPTLMKNWQEDRWKTENEVYKSRLFEGLSQMHARQRLTGYLTTETFAEGLKLFMKVTKTCDTASDCFVPQFTNGTTTVNSSAYNNRKKFGRDAWGTNVMGFSLANGSNAMLVYNPACKSLDPAAAGIEVADCTISILYDTNGKEGPNKMGTDIHLYNNLPENVDIGPLICKQIAADLELCGNVPSPWTQPIGQPARGINTCSSGHPYYRAGNASCANDHWAAAAESCEHFGKRLPTRNEGATIAANYPTSEWGGSGVPVWYWAKQENGSSSAYYIYHTIGNPSAQSNGSYGKNVSLGPYCVSGPEH